MINKKAQVPPYALIIGIFLLAGLAFGWFNSNQNCNEKLNQTKILNEQLRNQLSEFQSDLDNADKIIDNQNDNIANLTNELNNCKNSEPIISYEKFNLFWLTNVNVTKFTGFIINISFIFSLISIPLWKIYLFDKKKGGKKNDL